MISFILVVSFLFFSSCEDVCLQDDSMCVKNSTDLNNVQDILNNDANSSLRKIYFQESFTIDQTFTLSKKSAIQGTQELPIIFTIHPDYEGELKINRTVDNYFFQFKGLSNIHLKGTEKAVLVFEVLGSDTSNSLIFLSAYPDKIGSTAIENITIKDVNIISDVNPGSYFYLFEVYGNGKNLEFENINIYHTDENVRLVGNNGGHRVFVVFSGEEQYDNYIHINNVKVHGPCWKFYRHTPNTPPGSHVNSISGIHIENSDFSECQWGMHLNDNAFNNDEMLTIYGNINIHDNVFDCSVRPSNTKGNKGYDIFYSDYKENSEFGQIYPTFGEMIFENNIIKNCKIGLQLLDHKENNPAEFLNPKTIITNNLFENNEKAIVIGSIHSDLSYYEIKDNSFLINQEVNLNYTNLMFLDLLGAEGTEFVIKNNSMKIDGIYDDFHSFFIKFSGWELDGNEEIRISIENNNILSNLNLKNLTIFYSSTTIGSKTNLKFIENIFVDVNYTSFPIFYSIEEPNSLIQFDNNTFNSEDFLFIDYASSSHNITSTTGNIVYCKGHYQGDSCDICPENGNKEDNCFSCLNQWSGYECEDCKLPNQIYDGICLLEKPETNEIGIVGTIIGLTILGVLFSFAFIIIIIVLVVLFIKSKVQNIEEKKEHTDTELKETIETIETEGKKEEEKKEEEEKEEEKVN